MKVFVFYLLVKKEEATISGNWALPSCPVYVVNRAYGCPLLNRAHRARTMILGHENNE